MSYKKVTTGTCQICDSDGADYNINGLLYCDKCANKYYIFPKKWIPPHQNAQWPKVRTVNKHWEKQKRKWKKKKRRRILERKAC